MYYGSPMKDYEYMRIKYSEIPENVKQKYNLRTLQHDGWVYLQIRKGMPGLKQAGKIANERLTKHLERYGYIPVDRTPSLWKHRTRPVTFTLVVDDFGVKYVGLEHFNHLKSALCDLYEITVDMTGSKYLGMQINWNYDEKYVEISMPDYVKKALHRYQYVPTRPQHALHPAPRPVYGRAQQMTKPPRHNKYTLQAREKTNPASGWNLPLLCFNGGFINVSRVRIVGFTTKFPNRKNNV